MQQLFQLFLFDIVIALKNTAIHVLFWEGMLLGNVRIFFANRLDRLVGLKASKYIQKPLWDCLPCMASVWTIVWLFIDSDIPFSFHWICMILTVCGISALIDSALPNVCAHPENQLPD